MDMSLQIFIGLVIEGWSEVGVQVKLRSDGNVVTVSDSRGANTVEVVARDGRVADREVFQALRFLERLAENNQAKINLVREVTPVRLDLRREPGEGLRIESGDAGYRIVDANSGTRLLELPKTTSMAEAERLIAGLNAARVAQRVADRVDVDAAAEDVVNDMPAEMRGSAEIAQDEVYELVADLDGPMPVRMGAEEYRTRMETRVMEAQIGLMSKLDIAIKKKGKELFRSTTVAELRDLCEESGFLLDVQNDAFFIRRGADTIASGNLEHVLGELRLPLEGLRSLREQASRAFGEGMNRLAANAALERAGGMSRRYLAENPVRDRPPGE